MADMRAVEEEDNSGNNLDFGGEDVWSSLDLETITDVATFPLDVESDASLATDGFHPVMEIVPDKALSLSPSLKNKRQLTNRLALQTNLQRLRC